MRAVRFHDVGDVRLDAVPEPHPGSGEVVVAVDVCGVCGSDLHFLDGSARTDHVPITLGHEVAGRVLDPGDSGLAVGARVVSRPGEFCGACSRCAEGRPNLCQRARVLGIDFDGGLADLVSVPATMLLPIPAGLSPAAAATAVDAGATAFHAVTRTGRASRGDAVLIIGVGGLGSYGVQFARKAGAAIVIAADVDGAALERASALGADETILVEPTRSVGRQAKMITDGGVDLAIEFVGRASTVDAAVKSLRPGGRAVAVGVGIEPVTTLPPVLWSNNEYSLTGSYGSLPGDVVEVLEMMSDGSLQPIATTPIALAEAPEHLAALARGDERMQGRPAVHPGAWDEDWGTG